MSRAKARRADESVVPVLGFPPKQSALLHPKCTGLLERREEGGSLGKGERERRGQCAPSEYC